MEQVLAQAFPYRELPSTNVSLNRVTLANFDDSKRYLFGLDDDKKCSSLKKIFTDSQQEISELNGFIENPDQISPLLIKIPSDYNKIKLSVLIKVDHRDNNLLIIKSENPLHESEVAHYSSEDANIPPNLDVSKLSYASLPLKSHHPDFQRIVINDNIKGRHQKVYISTWEQDSTTQENRFLFAFAFWLEGASDVKDAPEKPPATPAAPPTTDASLMTTTTDTPSELPLQRSRHAVRGVKLSQYRRYFRLDIEDGPQLRKDLAHYEDVIPNFKKHTLGLLDEVKSVSFYIRKIIVGKEKVIERLRSLNRLNFTSILSQLGFIEDFESQFLGIFEPFEKNMYFFMKDVCDEKLLSKISANLSSMVSNDSTGSNELLTVKKQFENDSKEYYSWLNKYLSNEKERPQLKLLVKRKAFELSKFDYISHLRKVINNQYINQLLENFFKFNGLKYDAKNPKLLDFQVFNDAKNTHALLDDNYEVFLNAISRFNSQKFHLRQMIEASQSNEELTNIIRYNALNSNYMLPGDPSDDAMVTADNVDMLFSDPLRAVKDASPTSPLDSHADMLGILYTLGGQGKQGWHKEWVVLRNGQLSEYSDWRKGKVQINKPIELALSSVKAITYERRHHCFEIMTVDGTKHVFQAINEDERLQWIRALYAAGQVVDSSRLRENYHNQNHSPKQKNERGATNQHHDVRKQLSTLVTSLADVRPVVPGFHDRESSPVSIISKTTFKEKDYVALVMGNAQATGNDKCADCESTEHVEWISMNLLVCFCIQCSSSHRHLGSHISRIKSLKLDNFDDETELLLTYINNKAVNSYLEGNLSDPKPTATSLGAPRLEYIRKKYSEKRYLLPLEGPDETLIRAIQKIDVASVLRAIISGASVNINVQMSFHSSQVSQVVSLFEYSLRKFIELKEPLDSSLSHTKKLFVISELLVLNGSQIESIHLNEDIGITPEAHKYFETRVSRFGRFR